MRFLYKRYKLCSTTNKEKKKGHMVILLQIVMVSPGTHLVENYDSQSRSNEWQLKKRKKIEPKLKMLRPLCNQSVNLKTDSKSLYLSL